MSRLAVVAVATLALAGCGGGGEASDAEQIREVLDDYRTATASHNASLLCSEVIASPPPSLEECIDGVALAMSDPGSDLSRPQDLAPVGEPSIDGDRATQRVDDDGERYTVTLLRGRSGWRLVLGD